MAGCQRARNHTLSFQFFAVVNSLQINFSCLCSSILPFQHHLFFSFFFFSFLKHCLSPLHSSSEKSEDWCCIVVVQTHQPAKLELAVFIYSQHILAAIRFIFSAQSALYWLIYTICLLLVDE